MLGFYSLFRAIIQRLERFRKMNIKLGPAGGTVRPSRVAAARKAAAGAKAHIHFAVFSARLKSCPDTKQQRFGPLRYLPEQA
jgi:hypothetical protein